MTEPIRSPAFEEGAAAGRDVDKQVADCPYDHDPESGELGRRGEWLEGFASTRAEAGSAEEARHYREVGRKAQVSPDLPVYFSG